MDTNFNIWDLLENITEKQDWYSKVFNDNIVSKWSKELESLENFDKDVFWSAIQILRTTAQGASLYLKECKWKALERVCNDCREKLEEKIKKDECISDEDEIMESYFEITCDIENEFNEYCPHSLCICQSPDSKLDDYVEYYSSDLLSEELRDKLKDNLEKMMKEMPIDWHPGSNQQVRDIIHPSLYPYVKSISLKNGQIDECNDEKIMYSWLPAEIKTKEYNVTFQSYINNLDEEKFPEFKELMEKVLTKFLPSFEKILAHQKKGSLKNRNLQVIVKVASTHLTLDKPAFQGGSWHIEGMPYEHIIATGLHYLTVEGITESYLEFRKPVIVNEDKIDYPFGDSPYTSKHYGITPGTHHEGQMNRYLGLIKCQESSSVIFPNSLQHHVKNFRLGEDQNEGTRIILAFFLIDPDYPITSTKDVSPQQSIFSREEAEFYRERLMFFRKYYVDELNYKVYQREYSLCEH